MLIDKVRHKTMIGTPQGGVISPILSNIYLDKFDWYMEKIIEEENTAVTSVRNPEYTHKKSLLRAYKGKQRKKGYVELRTIKSTIRTGTRIYYVRYADD